MTENKPYKCVNCGEPSAALYKTYGPSVLKLTKCIACNGIVDKYIEYDPVIVMIDLVLVSREAQRHVLYNTEFKAYWKLFIILMMIETYGLWRSDSLFNIIVNTTCGIQTNSTTFNITQLPSALQWEAPAWWRRQCRGWEPDERDEKDLFIWEKHFYIQFISTFAGVTAFILTVHCIMKILKPFISQNEARLLPLVKAGALAQAAALLALPAQVWGAPRAAPALPRALVAGYSGAVLLNTLVVLYDCPILVAGLVMVAGSVVKFLSIYHCTPFIQELLQ